MALEVKIIVNSTPTIESANGTQPIKGNIGVSQFEAEGQAVNEIVDAPFHACSSANTIPNG